MADESSIDTFNAIKDGIKYQIMKENSKRTSFTSNNQQIVFKGRQVVQSIEKNEKLMSSDFRRQQTMLMDKLEKLQKKKETLGLMSTSRIMTERRHSEPIDRDLRTHSSLLHFRFKKSMTLMPNSYKNEDNAEHGSLKTQRSPTSQLHKQQKSRENLTNPRNIDVRRQSQEIQKEILATSLPKLEAIMASGHRRATISDSSSLTDYFPSSTQLSRLSRLWGKASSVDEGNG